MVRSQLPFAFCRQAGTPIVLLLRQKRPPGCFRQGRIYYISNANAYALMCTTPQVHFESLRHTVLPRDVKRVLTTHHTCARQPCPRLVFDHGGLPRVSSFPSHMGQGKPSMNDKLRGPATAYAHHSSPTSCQVLFHSFDIKRSTSRARLDANGTTYSAGHNPASRSSHIAANCFSGLEITYRSTRAERDQIPSR